MNKDIYFPHNYGKQASLFVSKLLNKNSSLRISAKEAVNDPWFTSENHSSVDPDLAFQALENMNNFLLGNNLRKTVMSYILARKIYEDKNDELTKLFQSIDKDKNGYIEKEEFFEFYSKFFPGTSEDIMDQLKELVESIDINNSNKIDYTEFLIVSNKLDQTLSRKKMEEVFHIFDVDKDNFIDANDLKVTLGDKMVNSKYQRMIDDFDKNGDKKLSLDEFIEMLTKYY